MNLKNVRLYEKLFKSLFVRCFIWSNFFLWSTHTPMLLCARYFLYVIDRVLNSVFWLVSSTDEFENQFWLCVFHAFSCQVLFHASSFTIFKGQISVISQSAWSVSDSFVIVFSPSKCVFKLSYLYQSQTLIKYTWILFQIWKIMSFQNQSDIQNHLLESYFKVNFHNHIHVWSLTAWAFSHSKLIWFGLFAVMTKRGASTLARHLGFVLTMWYKFNLTNDRLMNSKSARPAAKKTAVKKTAVKRPAAKKWESEIW